MKEADEKRTSFCIFTRSDALNFYEIQKTTLRSGKPLSV